ncbi:transcription initiation factor TFIID subunit 4 [Ischnura elegans]|uniref:transcription initiation factor TFIID subunit 4 n=1 Tax=Ischnura elegans TaxID=197161 RepID=UPI001ED8BD7A|nr:transcription initiation factor TFIID subunit 4 [Ischnura elegans]
MASAKFLEEALSTDVDESAVSAIVGSLETQLVTATPPVTSQLGVSAAVNQNHVNSAIANGSTVSTQKHGVSNGGSDSVNIILNPDPNKTIVTTALPSGSLVTPNVVNTVVAPLHGAVPTSGFMNQVTTSATQANLATLTKTHDAVKIVYPASSQTLTSSGGVNINNRVSFPTQTVATLPNGNLGLATSLQSQTVLNAVTSSVQSMVSQTHTQPLSNVAKQIGGVGVIGVDQGKGPGAALVIKTNNSAVTQGGALAAGVVSVPMTVNTTMTLTGSHVNTGVTATTSGVSGVVTLAKPITHSVGTSQTMVGNPSTTLLPASVQIVNVNAVRPGAPTQPGQKAIPPRVVIGAPHMVGARPGQPGQITLQTLQGLQPGTQGHLLLKTENGQYQLLRVGPAPTTPATLTPNNSATNITNTTTYRLQSVPAVSNIASHATVTVAATTPTTTNIPQNQSPVTTSQNANLQRNAMDSTKEKCRKFLANLLELSSREPRSVERNVRTLIQELIDAKVEPEEFCDRLERLLNASPQPCLIGFLKKSLPLLRQSLVTKELVIDGIRPPPHTVVFSVSPSGAMVPQIQIRQPVSTQVRVMSPANATHGLGVSSLPRPGPAIQHRLVAKCPPQAVVRPQPPPVTPPPPPPKLVSPATPATLSLPLPLPLSPHIGGLLPAAAITTTTTTTISSTITSTPSVAVTTSSPMPGVSHVVTSVTPTPSVPTLHVRPPVPPPPVIPKPIIKEKEKKFSSSSAYTGDDDINDVAAMGGVNLAEETQRILGSTEFVGTQIRSCKDEIFLHSVPLQLKIKQIVAKHGLEEPSSEVAALISHATQERLKNIVEKLAVIAEHRLDMIKMDPRYEVSQDVKAQLKFLEELDRLERKRHEEREREMLLRAAKSRSKSEDPEQAKLKAKAKEMQRAEMEELRQREANLTALQAIGPRKKPKLETSSSSGSPGQAGSGALNSTISNPNRTQLPLRPRVKRVNLRDLLFLLEQEKETCRTPLLYKAFLK